VKYLDKIPPWLKNRYTLILLFFLVWMTFFDRNDFISQYSYSQELKKLENDRDYYKAEIEKNKKEAHELMSDPDNLEKFAREKYLMKKDDEDIFLIVKEKKEEPAE
jgi:cell division protein FtsB